MVKKFKCYECLDDDCEASVDQVHCDDAILCLKWRMRYTDGSTRVGRGCISDDVVPFYACNDPSIYLHTECCQEDLCNGGLFPVLPDLLPGGSEMWSTTMVILVVLVLLLALGLVVCGIFWYYRNQRSRGNRSTTPRPAFKLIASGMKTWMLA